MADWVWPNSSLALSLCWVESQCEAQEQQALQGMWELETFVAGRSYVQCLTLALEGLSRVTIAPVILATTRGQNNSEKKETSPMDMIGGPTSSGWGLGEWIRTTTTEPLFKPLQDHAQDGWHLEEADGCLSEWLLFYCQYFGGCSLIYSPQLVGSGKIPETLKSKECFFKF